MSKRITPARSAAKRAAFTQQKQKFNAQKNKLTKFKDNQYGPGCDEVYAKQYQYHWQSWYNY